jgi:hypothetical protein
MYASRVASLAALLVSSISISGCGEVESGLCEGAQTDEVACTVDICNPEEMGGGWAHIPDHNLCEAGQRCDAKAGCVSSLAGSLSGKATLFAHADHSGITVTLVGTDPPVTATTDAAGAWRVEGVPAGVYAVKFEKATWIPQTLDGVTIVPEALAGTEAVELTHASLLATGYSINGSWQSPDKKVAYWSRLVNSSYYNIFGAAVDGSTGVRLMAQAAGVPYPANKAWVWKENDVIYSRRLDGSQPNRLGFRGPSDSDIQVVATGGEYTAILKTANVAAPNQSLWIAKTDGTAAPATTAIWTQTDVNVTFNSITMNDTHGILFLSHYAGGSPTPTADTLWRVDLAANTKAVITNGFPANSYGGQILSPDGTALYGWASRFDGSITWQRGFMLNMATGLPAYAPDYASSGANAKSSDRNVNNTNMGWLKDSSGFVFQAGTYLLADNSTTGEGQLKVWRKDQTTSTTLVARTAYIQPGGTAAFNTPSTVGTAVVFLDNTYNLKAVSADDTTPNTVTLDNSTLGIARAIWANTEGDAAYVVWAQATGVNSGVTGKFMSANMPLPLTAANTVQLGPNVAANCQTNYEAILPRTTFYMLCNDTASHVLTAFARSTTAATGTYPDVKQGTLFSVPGGDRAVFAKYDNRLYSAPAMGSTMALVSNFPNSNGPRLAFGDGLLFTDTATSSTFASAVDGSAVDELMFKGIIQTTFFDNELKNVLMPNVQVGYIQDATIQLSVDHMP